MQNQRSKNTEKKSKIGIIQKHLNNNLKSYIIVVIIFCIRCNTWSTIYK